MGSKVSPYHQMGHKEHEVITVEDSRGGSGRRRGRRCHCLCCSCPCLCYCLTTWFILIGLGVALFFVLPRIPKVTMEGIQATSNLALNNNVVTGQWVANLNATTDNWITYVINEVHVTVYDNKVQGVPIGSGSREIILPTRNQNASYQFPITVNYVTIGADNSRIHADFLAACVPLGPPLELLLVVRVFIDWLKVFNVVPTFNQIVQVNCPGF